MSLSEKLKNARKSKGLTQDDVAKALKIKNTTISNWETGVSRPDVDMLSALCSLYGVFPNDMLEWDCDFMSSSDKTYYLNPEAAEMAQELYERPEMRVLFDASRKATKEDIEQVADILKKLSGK